MTITTDAPFDTAAAGPVVALINLVELDFVAGTLYLTTLPIDIDWGGHTYKGIGTLGRVSQMQESEDGSTQTLDLELSQVNTSQLAAALGSVNGYQGRPARVRVALADSCFIIQGTPVLRFFGFMDLVKVARRDGQGVITMTCKTGGYDLRRNPTALRMNDPQHQAEHPGELGFAYVSDLIAKPERWLSVRFQQV